MHYYKFKILTVIPIVTNVQIKKMKRIEVHLKSNAKKKRRVEELRNIKNIQKTKSKMSEKSPSLSVIMLNVNEFIIVCHIPTMEYCFAIKYRYMLQYE